MDQGYLVLGLVNTGFCLAERFCCELGAWRQKIQVYTCIFGLKNLLYYL